MLALVTTPAFAGARAAEFLRIVLALRAVTFDVVLAEAGAGVGALEAALRRDDEEVGPLLSTLAAEGIAAEGVPDLAGAVAGAEALFVLSNPERSGTPAVLHLRRGEAPSKSALAAIAEAGQVVLQ